MPTEAEIKAKYKNLHDTLSENYYAGTSGLTKEEFDIQHGKIWANMEAKLIAGGYLIPPTAIHFVPGTPGQSSAKRIDNIEEFLKQLYP